MAQTHQFLDDLQAIVTGYKARFALKHEYLALLGWQIAQGDALDLRTTMPGHVTTSAIILSPDHLQVLLIDHIAIGRWLQPGGHYEPAHYFHQSAQREAVEETGIGSLRLHPWHGNEDVPLVIDSHEVPGKKARHEPDHIHHDLQYLFLADPSTGLTAQQAEVHAAAWKTVDQLAQISPKAWTRLRTIAAP